MERMKATPKVREGGRGEGGGKEGEMLGGRKERRKREG